MPWSFSSVNRVVRFHCTSNPGKKTSRPMSRYSTIHPNNTRGNSRIFRLGSCCINFLFTSWQFLASVVKTRKSIWITELKSVYFSGNLGKILKRFATIFLSFAHIPQNLKRGKNGYNNAMHRRQYRQNRLSVVSEWSRMHSRRCPMDQDYQRRRKTLVSEWSRVFPIRKMVQGTRERTTFTDEGI